MNIAPKVKLNPSSETASSPSETLQSLLSSRPLSYQVVYSLPSCRMFQLNNHVDYPLDFGRKLSLWEIFVFPQ